MPVRASSLRRPSFRPHLEHLETRILLNAAPSAVNDAYATNENSPLVVAAGSGVLANDTDPDSRLLRARLVSGPAHGALELKADGSFVYTPVAGFFGADAFTYRASDGRKNSAVATVNLTVQPVYDFAAVTARLQESVSTGALIGVSLIVLDGDSVLYQEAFGNQTLDTQLFIASATKLTSATVMMTLVDDGLVALDDPIARYLPQFTGAVGAITIRQLLAQTHGLPGNHRTLNAPGQDNGLTLEQCVDAIAADFASGRLQPVRPAGTAFEYSPGISYQIFGRIAEVVTGQTWDTLWHERVGDPLQMTSTTYGTTANPRLAGGMASTLGDYGRLVQTFLNGGVSAGGVRILSAAAVAEMLRNQVAGLPFNGSQAMDTEGYGLSWWHNQMDTVVSVPGAYGAIPWLDLAHGYAGFLLTYDLQADSVPVWEDIVPLISAELRAASAAGSAPEALAAAAPADAAPLPLLLPTGKEPLLPPGVPTSGATKLGEYSVAALPFEATVTKSARPKARPGYLVGLLEAEVSAMANDLARKS